MNIEITIKGEGGESFTGMAPGSDMDVANIIALGLHAACGWSASRIEAMFDGYGAWPIIEFCKEEPAE